MERDGMGWGRGRIDTMKRTLFLWLGNCTRASLISFSLPDLRTTLTHRGRCIGERCIGGHRTVAV
jgi:hypothetical protein